MSAFGTLLWLEFRKQGTFALGMLMVVAGWSLLLRQFFAWGAEPSIVALAVVASTLMLAGAVVAAYLLWLGLDFAREYRNGRWSLLLGAPQPGWLHLSARLLFACGALTLFAAGMWGALAFWLGRVGLEWPLGLGFALWAYGLGGAVLVVPVLFIGLLVAAYLPARAGLLAFLVGLLGLGQLSEWGLRLFGEQFYRWLPPWRLPLPSLGQVPLEGFPGLPSEAFILLLGFCALLFLVMSRLWQEVEV